MRLIYNLFMTKFKTGCCKKRGIIVLQETQCGTNG